MINKKLLKSVFRDQIELNDKIYKIDFNSAHPRIIVEHSNEIPSSLYKYINVYDSYGVENLINYNLFCSEPDSLNDIFDTQHALLHSNAYEKEQKGFERLLRIIFSDRSSDINKLKKQYKDDFAQKCRDTIWSWWVSSNGILCLTDSPESDLMWAHYTKNEGFAIEFKTEFLPTNLSRPIPMNYSNLNELFFIDKKNILLEIYIRALSKKVIWSYENEYRCFFYPENNKYLSNFGIFSNQKYPGNKQSRILNYDQKAILSVTLGFNFFKNLIGEKNKKGFKIKFNKESDQNKAQVTEFLYSSKMICFLIFIDSKSIEIKRRQIFIEKLESNKFNILFME